MRSYCTAILSLSVIWQLAAAYQNSTMTKGELWPLPQKIHYSGRSRIVHANVLRIVFEGVEEEECDILQHLKEKYAPGSERIFDNHGHELTLVVKVGSCPKMEEYPQAGMDEECKYLGRDFGHTTYLPYSQEGGGAKSEMPNSISSWYPPPNFSRLPSGERQ